MVTTINTMSTYWLKIVRNALILLSLWWVSASAHAQLNIEIFGGGATRIPVAIVPFADENKLQQGITPVISADLQRTGLFKLVDPSGLSPHAPADVVYADWTNRGANALVIGRVVHLSTEQVEIQFRVMDIAKKSQLTGLAITVPTTQLRAAAHRIADDKHFTENKPPGQKRNHYEKQHHQLYQQAGTRDQMKK